MERDDESKKMLDQALSAGDDWLRKQGVITDFSINTIIAWVYLNFEKVENVELDVDRPKQRIYARIYLGFWTLLLMTLFRQKDELLDTIYNRLAEYLPTYEISVELKRWKGAKREKFSINPIVSSPDDTDNELPEGEGNIAEALRARKTHIEDSKNSTSIAAKPEQNAESTVSPGDSDSSENKQS